MPGLAIQLIILLVVPLLFQLTIGVLFHNLLMLEVQILLRLYERASRLVRISCIRCRSSLNRNSTRKVGAAKPHRFVSRAAPASAPAHVTVQLTDLSPVSHAAHLREHDHGENDSARSNKSYVL